MKNTILLGLFFLLFSIQSYAAPVKLKMPNGLVANANYIKGNPAKPTVFLLHGFLQTHNFSTISRLSDSLSSEGYSVFSPTLTLGIPGRNKSLACEALHDHTMEDDQAEIDTWVKWLNNKGHKEIVLMGHSQGSVSLLSYLANKKNKTISKYIAVSILQVNMSDDKDENKRLRTMLQQKISENSRMPFTRKLSFCIKYLGTPRSYYSYQSWSTEKILKEIKSLNIPLKIIMGGGDNRIRNIWIKELKSTGKPISVIEGANHFMDGFNEFDLLELVLKELDK
jgi:esterase/lipase